MVDYLPQIFIESDIGPINPTGGTFSPPVILATYTLRRANRIMVDWVNEGDEFEVDPVSEDDESIMCEAV